MHIVHNDHVSIVEEWVHIEQAGLRCYRYSVTVPIIRFGGRVVVFDATSETSYRKAILFLSLLNSLIHQLSRSTQVNDALLISPSSPLRDKKID
jgi:hypothetical protein